VNTAEPGDLFFKSFALFAGFFEACGNKNNALRLFG